MAVLDPMPQQDPIGLDAEQRPIYMGGRWLQWFYNAITVRMQQSPLRLGTVTRLFNPPQNASISATPLSLGSLSAGRYRIHWYARITTVDAVSSSLTVSIGWTETAQALSVSGPAMTGNALTTVQSGTVYAEVDGNSPITYATTYVSNTPGQMKYRLSVQVESLP